MFTVIGLMLAGMLTGFLLHKYRLGFIHPVITLLIWVLLFLLGMEVGGNDAIIRGLHTIGLEALILTIGGTLGSVIAAKVLWQMLEKKKKVHTPSETFRPVNDGNLWQALKGSLIIVGFFVLGILGSLLEILPAQPDSDINFYALCALMTSVGISVGNDPQTLKNFRSLNPRLVFLPVMTIVGTLTGTAIVSFLLTHRSLTDCLAIGSGFGYYSLSSSFIT